MVKNKISSRIILTAAAFLVLCAAVFSDTVFTQADQVKDISVPFSSAGRGVLKWNFPYSDDFFSQPSDVFSTDLAKASIGLAVSAFKKELPELDEQYETYLGAAGFENIFAFGYDQETSADTVSGVIASKKIGDTVLIAAVPAGQGYKKEWAGNMEVGDGERHEGFNKAARIMEDHILSYIKEHKLEGRLKLWLSGFSRASAISNITAADMIDSGLFEDVYAYLCAVPRTTKAENYDKYVGIYNICGTYDPVTQIPMQSWGYERYGIDLYLPVPEMNSDYITLAANNYPVSTKLIGDGFWYNPVISYQLHMIIEFMGELFPTNAEYAEDFQDILMNVWTDRSEGTFFEILSVAISRLEDLDERQAYSSEIFINYLQYISSQLLKEDPDQIKEGYWNPKQSLMENVLREHMPYTYIIWLFSDNDVNSVYYDIKATRRLYFFGNADIEIYKDGKFVKGLKAGGDYIYPDEEELAEMTINDFLVDVFLTKNGILTQACLPLQEGYELHIHTDKNERIQYYDVICMPYLTYGLTDTMFFATVDQGDYILRLDSAEILNPLLEENGHIDEIAEVPMEYSTTMIMADESGSDTYTSVPELFFVILTSLLTTAVILFLCLIIFIVHLIRRKKRGRPYSAWYVIVPHLLLVILFAFLTRYFTFYLYAVSITRVICSALTMAVIFLLALRGLLRIRCLRNLFISAALLTAGVVNVLLYQTSSMVSSAVVHFIVYGLVLAALCALAAITFLPKGKFHKKTV